MRNEMGFASGLGVGMGLMYYLDPGQGRRRRARIRDQMVHTSHEINDGLILASRDLANRTRGLLLSTKSRIDEDLPIDDAVLTERIRARMGHVISHPHSIQVKADHGTVILQGEVPSDEVNPLMLTLLTVRGVQQIDNQLKLIEPIGERQHRWSHEHLRPSSRLLLGSLSLGSMMYGVGRKDVLGFAASLLGSGFLIRALANRSFRSIFGFGQNIEPIHVHKSIPIRAPVDSIYRFWNNFENLSHFLPDVENLSEIEPDRHHWRIAGPAGIPIEWTSIITQNIPNQTIAWTSEPNALIQHSGRIRFHSNSDQSTQVEIDLFYLPLAGTLGHAIAHFFGADPKSKMDDDLMRVKTLLETGPAERQRGRIFRR